MRSMRRAFTGVVLVLASCGGGSSSTTNDVSSTSTVAGTEVAYKLGDTGPGGGIIVSVDEAGFSNSGGENTSIGAMCLPTICHYLEMASTDVGGVYSWDDAIAEAEAFSTPSANDWMLPSKDALNEMCKYAFGDTAYATCNDEGNGNLTFTNSVGGFSENNYWSSSEDADEGYDDFAWAQYFGYGGQSSYPKDGMGYVRPVRAF